MAKFTVWFEQVNKSKYEVETRTELSALRKAQREWLKDNNNCPSWYMENENGEEVK